MPDFWGFGGSFATLFCGCKIVFEFRWPDERCYV